VLSQDGRSCPLTAKVDDYRGMAELSRALEAGMTPVMSYWSANDMLWMDGVGSDGAGPCVKDDAAACADHVRFYDFSVSTIGSGGGRKETLHETLIGLQEQPHERVITDCAGEKGKNCTGVDIGSASLRVAGEDADVVQVIVKLNASDLPSAWGQGQDVVLFGPEHRQIHGEDTSAVGSVTTRIVLVILLTIAVAAAAFRKVCMACVPGTTWWQRSLHTLTSAKAHFQSKAGGDSSARPLSLRLGESPVRRRKGDGGVGQAPQEAGSHPRWPSDVQASPQVSTPGRWPLMSTSCRTASAQ